MIHRPEPSACTLGALEEKRQRTRRGLQGCPDDPTPVRVTGNPWKATPVHLCAHFDMQAEDWQVVG
jgi:hypothetical protein